VRKLWVLRQVPLVSVGDSHSNYVLFEMNSTEEVDANVQC